MSRYNLLDEQWIEVISSETGEQKNVSMIELFNNADQYKCLAGDMKTQDFALLRFLLAVLQTVFSRVDYEGNPYTGVELNDCMQQTNELDEDDEDDYSEEVEDCWKQIWKSGHFPDVVCRYLEEWRGHFYLYDDKYPFYQLTNEEMEEIVLPGKKASEFAGRNLNRLISESGNKTAMFSPVADDQKDIMTSDQLVRWLIMLQGYIGLSDKTKYKGIDMKPSKGWMFDIGGLFLEGDNLFETLMLNFIPLHPDNSYNFYKQRPCWEQSGMDNAQRLGNSEAINNLAELYTNWSRAIYINPEHKDEEPVDLYIVKLPEILHRDNFLEPMTLWKMNHSGDNKDHFTPKVHEPDKGMWRSFGLITLKSAMDSDQHQPAIMTNLDNARKFIGSKWINLQAVSMRNDGNATSWVPVDEIADEMTANNLVISDSSDNGWIVRINDTVNMTKKIASIYWHFLSEVAEIRGKKPEKDGKIFIEAENEKLYQNLNEPFRMWLTGIKPKDSKDNKVSEWYDTLKNIALSQAESLVDNASTRDFTGIIKEDHIFNIFGAYKKFRNIVLKELGNRGERNGQGSENNSREGNKSDH